MSCLILRSAFLPSLSTCKHFSDGTERQGLRVESANDELPSIEEELLSPTKEHPSANEELQSTEGNVSLTRSVAFDALSPVTPVIEAHAVLLIIVPQPSSDLALELLAAPNNPVVVEDVAAPVNTHSPDVMGPIHQPSCGSVGKPALTRQGRVVLV